MSSASELRGLLNWPTETWCKNRWPAHWGACGDARARNLFLQWQNCIRFMAVTDCLRDDVIKQKLEKYKNIKV